MLDEQEWIPRKSMQIAIFANQAGVGQSRRPVQKTATVSHARNFVSKPMRVLRKRSEQLKNGKTNKPRQHS